MQLKKQFAIKRQLAAGAMTAVMLVTALPALASENGFEARGDAGVKAGFGVNADLRALQEEIRGELKEVRKELKASANVSGTQPAGTPSQVTERKHCKKDAEAQFRASLEKARDEREASMKAGQQAYLNSLKSARDAFRARIAAAGITLGLGQLTLSATAQAELKAAREAYQQAVKTASQTFNEAKKKAGAAYHEELKSAKTARENAIKTCKA